jgi:hypothetical protein
METHLGTQSVEHSFQVAARAVDIKYETAGLRGSRDIWLP